MTDQAEIERDVMEYDVVTVGAGPAGLAYATVAAERAQRAQLLADQTSLRLSTDFGPYSSSVSLNLAALTGKNVENNTRAQLRVAVDRDVWRGSHSVVNMGVAFSAWHYGKDLSEYSFGHGGYYSPRSYASLALPVEWSGRHGALTWLARGSVSVSRSSSAELWEPLRAGSGRAKLAGFTCSPSSGQ